MGDFDDEEKITDKSINKINSEKAVNSIDDIGGKQVENQNQLNSNKKTVGFWLGIFSVIIVVLQLIFSYLNINFDVKIIVEFTSFVLAILVIFGVLKSSSKLKNVTEIKEEIKEQFTDKISEIKSTETEEIKKDSKQGCESDKKTNK